MSNGNEHSSIITDMTPPGAVIVEQEWVTITSDTIDDDEVDDECNNIILSSDQPQPYNVFTPIRNPKRTMIQSSQRREEPPAHYLWNNDAIQNAFQKAIRSHDYDNNDNGTIHQKMINSNNYYEHNNNINQNLPSQSMVTESSNLCQSSSSTPTATTKTTTTTIYTHPTHNTTSSTWEPRPLPLPTWAIDAFLHHHTCCDEQNVSDNTTK